MMAKGLDLKQFLKKLVARLDQDHVTSSAATLAYFFMLALSPAAIFLISLLGVLHLPSLQEEISRSFLETLPSEAGQMMQSLILSVTTHPQPGLLSLGFVFTLWSASTAMVAAMQEMNIAYGIKETRTYLRVRGRAVILTVGFAILVLLSFGLILLGSQVEHSLTQIFGTADWQPRFFGAIRWLMIAGMILLSFSLVYFYGPNLEQKYRLLSPGSIFSAIVFIVTSIGFKIYVANFGKYNIAYGSLGAAIVLMLWLYILGLIVLVGAHVNALISETVRS